MLMLAELKGCVTWFIYFLDLVWLRYNCAKFHHCRICVPDLMEGRAFLPPPHPWAAPKKPILNRVKIVQKLFLTLLLFDKYFFKYLFDFYMWFLFYLHKIKIFLRKKTIDQLPLFFFPKEHVHTLNSNKLKISNIFYC